MTKAKIKKFDSLWINVGLYNFHVLPVINTSFKDVQEYIRSSYGVHLPAPDSHAVTYCFKSQVESSYLSVIFIDKISTDLTQVLGLLTHEVNHAALHCLNNIGHQSVDTLEHEYFCYLSQKLLIECLNKTKLLNHF
jgi:uncharacterized protein YjaZ